MFQLKEEIDKTIYEYNLSFVPIENEDKKIFINNLYNIFVKNNPRALWLDFKYKPKSIEYNESPHKELAKIITNEKDVYFIIDSYNEEYYIYKSKIKNVVKFIDECIGLDEYYIIYDDFRKLICETDHGDLLYIDIEENELRI